MRTLIPFFLLVVAVVAFFIVLPTPARQQLFTRRNLAIFLFVVCAWIAVLVLAAVQSSFTIPLF